MAGLRPLIPEGLVEPFASIPNLLSLIDRPSGIALLSFSTWLFYLLDKSRLQHEVPSFSSISDCTAKLEIEAKLSVEYPSSCEAYSQAELLAKLTTFHREMSRNRSKEWRSPKAHDS
jgi:hypothetical protein